MPRLLLHAEELSMPLLSPLMGWSSRPTATKPRNLTYKQRYNKHPPKACLLRAQHSRVGEAICGTHHKLTEVAVVGVRPEQGNDEMVQGQFFFAPGGPRREDEAQRAR